MGEVLIQPRIDRVAPYVDLALAEGLRMELIEPAHPGYLDRLDGYFERCRELIPAEVPLALHGPFIDIALHSADREIREASRRRVRASLAWAQEIGVTYLILHGNHLPMINETGYDEAWLRGHLEFFSSLDFGAVTVVLENMWDPTPDLLLRLVAEAGSDRLRLCLDVAHWNVYGTVSLEEWLRRAGAFTPYIQYGDNQGDRDADMALGAGSVDWAEVDRTVRRWAPSADVMVGVGDDDGTKLTASLAFLREHGVYPFPVAEQVREVLGP
ncbi:sugar phosphate isomerase/epimerase family protein [Streptomyces sp. NRRL F-5123]|uniref:sugar phosphate isomerase/epimerase family protein n=1 Tax=Streptomyces sp. NRRL F-5123 TaxID=1463856 RepID=UPI0004E1D058|nr:TIM barrel protein [Streptomyces sp. NRRL F-5123]